MNNLFRHPFLFRLFHWEFWSFHAIYAWLYPIWLLMALRARSLFFFAAANPRIRNGGFTNESKKDIYMAGPLALFPRSVFFTPFDTKEAVLHALAEGAFPFPLVAKPDVGARGQGVTLLKGEDDLDRFLHRVNMPFHIQEYVAYPNEVGIFYCRLPNEADGRITGIVRKEFLTVTGNGIHTLDELMRQHSRAALYLKSLRAMNRQALTTVLPAGATQVVSPYGNHARGAIFLDDSHLIDDQLMAFMDALCSQIPDFFYGRLDIRFADWNTLRQGKDFKVIEINGAGSEPTHMYDPSHSLFFAWKEIIRHWNLLLKISRQNHRAGHAYLTFQEGMAMLREEKQWRKKLQAMQEWY